MANSFIVLLFLYSRLNDGYHMKQQKESKKGVKSFPPLYIKITQHIKRFCKQCEF